jgi:hypothetical protein
MGLPLYNQTMDEIAKDIAKFKDWIVNLRQRQK